MPGFKQPWIPVALDDTADKTARIRVLEVQQEHTAVAFEKLNNKVDVFAENTGQQLNQLSEDLRDFRNSILTKELQEQEKKHNKEILAEREKSETGAKVKFIWTGLGIIFAALVTVLFNIFKTRFGG